MLLTNNSNNNVLQILPCMVDLAGGVVPKTVSVVMCDHVIRYKFVTGD